MDSPNVYTSNHPIVLDKLSRLREASTKPDEFRRLIAGITLFLGYEATRNLTSVHVDIETPLQTMDTERVGCIPVLVPILRAGLGMTEAMLQLLPDAAVGHIGLFRDHGTLAPVEYYVKLPKSLAGQPVFLLDPMLATGGSSAYAVELLKDRSADIITLISVVAAPEGVQRMQQLHPDVSLYTGAVDQRLNGDGYILPGLGDAGDRIFNTMLF